MTIVLDLAPEQEARLRAEAALRGMTPAAYLKGLANLDTPSSEIADWEAMLDSFEEGEAEDHRETLTLLQKSVDEDRPGQRRIFGTCANLPLSDEQAGA